MKKPDTVRDTRRGRTAADEFADLAEDTDADKKFQDELQVRWQVHIHTLFILI